MQSNHNGILGVDFASKSLYAPRVFHLSSPASNAAFFFIEQLSAERRPAKFVQFTVGIYLIVLACFGQVSSTLGCMNIFNSDNFTCSIGSIQVLNVAAYHIGKVNFADGFWIEAAF